MRADASSFVPDKGYERPEEARFRACIQHDLESDLKWK